MTGRLRRQGLISRESTNSAPSSVELHYIWYQLRLKSFAMSDFARKLNYFDGSLCDGLVSGALSDNMELTPVSDAGADESVLPLFPASGMTSVPRTGAVVPDGPDGPPGRKTRWASVVVVPPTMIPPEGL